MSFGSYCYYELQVTKDSWEINNAKEEMKLIKSDVEEMKLEIEKLRREKLALSEKVFRLQSRVASLEMIEKSKNEDSILENVAEDGNLSKELLNAINESQRKRDQWERSKTGNFSETDSLDDFGDT